MKHSITKNCADSLRFHLNDKHGIKLKSGHAHEIVAAFFGYKSKIALLSDERFPVENLESAAFIVLDLAEPLIAQRLTSLEGLPSDLPSIQILAEAVYECISSDRILSAKVFHDFHGLALSIAKERMNQHTKHLWDTPPIAWINEVKIDVSENEALAVVAFNYPVDGVKYHSYCDIRLNFPRIAGNVGYGEPIIHPTFYSGQMRDPEFRMKSSTL